MCKIVVAGVNGMQSMSNHRCDINCNNWWFNNLVVLFFFFFLLTLCSINITFSGSFIYFFLTFDGSIVTLGSTNITCACTFITFNGFFFLLIFDRFIVTLSCTNITYGCSELKPSPPNYLIIDEYI